MQVIFGLNGLKKIYPKVVATLGVFDGVHRGHQKIVRKVVQRARTIKGTSMVLTFEFHPMKILCPGLCPPYLTTLDQKLALLKKAGVQKAVVIPFNRRFASIPAKKFVSDVLLKKIQVKDFMVGADYRFGNKAEGDILLLSACAKEYGFKVTLVAPAYVNKKVVSSTWIRQLIQQGELRFAAQLLGHAHSLIGKVVRGARRGRKLKIPTANFYPRVEDVLPKIGVYAVYVLVEGTRTRGVCNIGLRPTFHKKKQKQTIPWPLLEAHLLDTKKNLYGKIIDVQFIERLRAEKKFSSPYLLKKQIIKDIQKARECLRTVDYHGGRHPLSFSEGNL